MRLDPDYPKISRLFPNHVTDTVFEYRSYGVVLVWSFLLALVPAPQIVFGFLLGCWGMSAWRRSFYYTSEFRWWEQAWKESPAKMRVQLKYSELLMESIWKRYQAGAAWDSPALQNDIARAMMLQDQIAAAGKL